MNIIRHAHQKHISIRMCELKLEYIFIKTHNSLRFTPKNTSMLALKMDYPRISFDCLDDFIHISIEH